MRRQTLQAITLAILSFGPLAGCSKFNMVPPCEEMGEGVALALIPNSLIPAGGRLDRTKVAALIGVSDLHEIDSGYNQRTCRGVLTLKDGSDQVTTDFRVEQSEGAQHWQVITFLGRGDPAFDSLTNRVVTAYAERP